MGYGKLKAPFRYILLPDLTCKIIQLAKQVGMDFLQALCRTDFRFADQITFKERIGLFFARQYYCRCR